MLLDANIIAKYMERYLSSLFLESIKIEVKVNHYVINGVEAFKIYPFWNKTDNELLNDYETLSFKGDIISTMFFFLSGYWEYTHNNIKDHYGRFPARESFLYKKNVLEEPTVDILAHTLKDKLNLRYRITQPRAFITHDIDYLGLLVGANFIRSLASSLLKAKDVNFFIDELKKKLSNDDPWRVEKLIEIHCKEGTKGTFFFLPCLQPGDFRAGYSLTQNKQYFRQIKKEIESIKGDIGIHYDIRHLEEERMGSDINKLESVFQKKIKIGRAHFLLFDINRSFDIYERAGIGFDSSCSYAERVGFRFGTSKPFRPYNFKEEREYHFIEIPLIIMDGTLSNHKYMNLTPEEGYIKTKSFIDKIKKFNGVLTLLWHNSSFYTIQWRQWEKVFLGSLSYLKENNFVFI